MIPDFKTYINESVWGDLRKKSLGQETRIEDDVDSMDKFGFIDYIRKNYYTTDTSFSSQFAYVLGEDESNKDVTVLFSKATKGKNIYYYMLWIDHNIKKDAILFGSGLREAHPEMFKKLNDNFKIITTKFNKMTVCVVEPDKEVTYSLFLKILDFIVDMGDENVTLRRKDINESVWGDIRKKSLGQEKRIENDIDLMDMPSLKEYLKERYIFMDNRECVQIAGESKELYIYFYKHKEVAHTRYFVLWFYPERGMITFSNSLSADCPGIYKTLKERFDIKSKLIDGFWLYVMKSDKNTINSFLIEVLDYLIDSNCKDVILKKRDINESVWGDLRKKSLGQEERLEDNVNDLTVLDFYKYILDRYKCTEWKINNYTSFYVIAVPFLDIDGDTSYSVHYNYSKYDKHISINKRVDDLDPDLIKKIKDNYTVTTDKNDELFIISPTDGSEPTQQFFIDVLEFLRTNTSKKRIILFRKDDTGF